MAKPNNYVYIRSGNVQRNKSPALKKKKWIDKEEHLQDGVKIHLQ